MPLSGRLSPKSWRTTSTGDLPISSIFNYSFG